jgi:6-phosphogluconate dehydrogenase (decarboxylating)
MIKPTALASATMIGVALISGPALAQGAAQTAAIAKVDVQTLAAGYRAPKVTGSNVVNDANESIGMIDDLLVSSSRFVLNMPDIAEVWRRGSVISSWLLDLGAAALVKDPQLKEFSGYVQHSGEKRWTVEAAIEEAVPADVLFTALYARFRSRQA